MAYGTQWEREYDRTITESSLATQRMNIIGQKRSWPAAGLNVPTQWNPQGNPMFKGEGPAPITRSV